MRSSFLFFFFSFFLQHVIVHFFLHLIWLSDFLSKPCLAYPPQYFHYFGQILLKYRPNLVKLSLNVHHISPEPCQVKSECSSYISRNFVKLSLNVHHISAETFLQSISTSELPPQYFGIFTLFLLYFDVIIIKYPL
jgi:hypothetical protein